MANRFQSAALEQIAAEGPPVFSTQAAQARDIARATLVPQVKSKAGASAAADKVTEAVAPVAQQTQAQATQQQIARAQSAAQTQQNVLQNAITQRKINLDQASFNQQQRLGNLSNELKHRLVDSNLAFERDQQGRTFFTQRQLADWAKLKARNAEDFENYRQSAIQAAQRKEMFLRTMQARVEQQLTQASQKSIAEVSQETRSYLQKAKNALQDELREMDAAAAANSALYGGIGTVVGGIAGAIGGAYVGGPAGAMAGAGAGGAVGGGLGEAYAQSQTGGAGNAQQQLGGYRSY